MMEMDGSGNSDKTQEVKTKEAADSEVQGPPRKNAALLLMGHGGYDKLAVVEKEIPQEVPPGHVLVNVKACGLNFAECSMRQGFYRPMPVLPAIIGYEGAGVVEKIGEGVSNIQVGSRVICVNPDSMWQEYVVLKSEHCHLLPSDMSFVEGAALPVNYLTAYMMLFRQAQVKKGQSVLCHMAAGGVGWAVGQLCKSVGDVTLFGTASLSKHEQIKTNGYTHPIDYHSTDYADEVRKVCPMGVDIVLDPLGGKDSTKGYNLLKPLGTIVTYGGANFVPGENRNLVAAFKTWWQSASYSSMSLMQSSKRVAGLHLGVMSKDETCTPIIAEAMESILELQAQGHVKPRIDSVWPFEKIGEAMGRIHGRLNVGKVILTPRALN